MTLVSSGTPGLLVPGVPGDSRDPRDVNIPVVPGDPRDPSDVDVPGVPREPRDPRDHRDIPP